MCGQGEKEIITDGVKVTKQFLLLFNTHVWSSISIKRSGCTKMYVLHGYICLYLQSGAFNGFKASKYGLVSPLGKF